MNIRLLLKDRKGRGELPWVQTTINEQEDNNEDAVSVVQMFPR